jgi:putative oxidoreductase
MNKLLTLEFLPRNSDLALLLLRVGFGVSIMWLHGWGKLTKVLSGDLGFADPVGLGGPATAIIAVFAEFICPAFVVLGLWTRFACIIPAATMGVIVGVVSHFNIATGKGSELALLYFAGFFAILIAGPGKYSFDKK